MKFDYLRDLQKGKIQLNEENLEHIQQEIEQYTIEHQTKRKQQQQTKRSAEKAI